jgi:hypothetical protein
MDREIVKLLFCFIIPCINCSEENYTGWQDNY